MRWFLRLGFAPGLLAFIFVLASFDTARGSLSIVKDGTGIPTLALKGKPVLAFGPSPQHILTYLPRASGDDYTDWLAWARRYRLENVRSYPPSIAVESPAADLFERAAHDPSKFDLKRFNNAYFIELRKACQEFESAGIVVHLQLWQAVHWKKAWGRNYYNPDNNVNPEISRNAGPGEFSTVANPALLEHQIAYVHQILDATADVGNVFYDIMNEIGNGTSASREWVDAIIEAVLSWEKAKGIDVLLTLNDEGGKRLGDFSLTHPRLDLIVKDLGRYDEHVAARLDSGKPTISVRNIDYHYSTKKRFYFSGRYNLEATPDADLQARGRKYWWRMYMAGAVAASGYADSIPIEDGSQFFSILFEALSRIGWYESPGLKRSASYRLNTLAEENFLRFVNFTEIAGSRLGLQPVAQVVSRHPVANSYCLQNNEKAIIYLESPTGESGHVYPAGTAALTGLGLKDGRYRLLVYHPESGNQVSENVEIHNGGGLISLPVFKDDLALLIH